MQKDRGVVIILEHFFLPKTITNIGDEVFDMCHQLDILMYGESQSQWETVDKV